MIQGPSGAQYQVAIPPGVSGGMPFTVQVSRGHDGSTKEGRGANLRGERQKKEHHKCGRCAILVAQLGSRTCRRVPCTDQTHRVLAAPSRTSSCSDGEPRGVALLRSSLLLVPEGRSRNKRWLAQHTHSECASLANGHADGSAAAAGLPAAAAAGLPAAAAAGISAAAAAGISAAAAAGISAAAAAAAVPAAGRIRHATRWIPAARDGRVRHASPGDD